MPPATDTPPQGATADLIGKTIKGRYRVVRLLGRGAMGNVYEVMHERLRSSFALKQLRADLESEPEIVSRFRHEAEIMARLSHPNVARVFDIDAEPGIGSWMAMELVHGEDLGELMRRKGRLPLGEALRIGFQIATALDCAHRAGLVHRDIKPANVLIEEGTLRAVLTDFGIAKSRVPAEADAATRTGVFLGTYRYSSPEQLRNLRGVAIDARADVYSLGVVLYEMVSGRKFLAGLGESEVLSEVGFNAAWRPPLSYPDPLPAALAELIARCLAPDRDQRIAGAGAVAEKLATIAAALPPAGAALPPVVAPAPIVTAGAAPAAAPASAQAAVPPGVVREPTALTRRRAGAARDRASGIQSALRPSPAARRGRRWPIAGLAVLLLVAGAVVALGDHVRALLGLEIAHGPEIQQAQPADKVVWLTRSEPRWFSVVVAGIDPERPPRMRWYLNDTLVAESTTMWEYDPAKNLQDLTARGEVRFLLGAGRLAHQSHMWATQTAAKDLSPVLQSASYKPGSTIAAAVGETVVIEVSAIDPDDSPLTYTWRVDGKRVGGNAPRLAFEAKRDARITLAISDGGAVVSSSWNVVTSGKQPRDATSPRR